MHTYLTTQNYEHSAGFCLSPNERLKRNILWTVIYSVIHWPLRRTHYQKLYSGLVSLHIYRKTQNVWDILCC